MISKVLHVTQATGGVETSLLLLFRHHDRRRFELHLACPPGVALASAAAALGVRVIPIPMVRSVNPYRDAAGLFALWRLMRRERYAIVHAHSAKGGYLARVAARLSGTRPVLYAPRAFSYLSQRGIARKFFLLLERVARPFTDVVVATSESERQRAMKDVGFARDRVAVIPNGIDVMEMAEVAKTNVARPRSAPTVLMIGRLSYQKNPAMFVRVAGKVVERHPTVRFVLNGGGFASPEEDRTRALIASMGLDDRVEVVQWGTKSEAIRRIAECTIFVLTSRFEGMPNTVLEAMSLGCPVVATDVDGTRDVVRHGETGFLVPVDGDDEMASAIMRLLEERGLAARYGARAAAVAASEYDVRRTVRAVEALYRTCLEGDEHRRDEEEAMMVGQSGSAD